MEKRPAFGKYAGHFPAFMIKRPVRIDGTYYTFKDYPMLLMGNLLIIAAMFFVYAYSPITPDPYGSQAMTFAITLGITLTAAYWLFFAYFFGRLQDDSIQKGASRVPYLDGGDGEEARKKKPKPTREERVQAWRSRGAFAAFVILFGLLVTLYSTVLYTPIYVHLYKEHQQDLNQLAEIAGRYEELYIEAGNGVKGPYMEGHSGETDINQLTEQEQKDLKRIYLNLQSVSVDEIVLFDEDDGRKTLRLYIYQQGNLYDTVWYSYPMTREQVAKDLKTDITSVAQVGDNWWWIEDPYKNDEFFQLLKNVNQN